MWALINHPSNLAFSLALGLMLFLGLIELISMLFGGFSDLLDGLLPDDLTSDFHSEVGIDATGGMLLKLLSWLYVGKIPVMIWLVVFLAVFGGMGLALQNTVHSFSGVYVPLLIASAVVLFLSLPVVRWIAAGVYHVIPKDETTAINQDDLLGRVAVVVLGVASQGSPAQARVKDQFGQTHYIMVEPDTQEPLPQGSHVLLVSNQQTVFRAILNPHPELLP